MQGQVGVRVCGTCGGGGGEEWARRTPISALRVWLGGGLLKELELQSCG